jgi:hypothetical protein
MESFTIKLELKEVKKLGLPSAITLSILRQYFDYIVTDETEITLTLTELSRLLSFLPEDRIRVILAKLNDKGMMNVDVTGDTALFSFDKKKQKKTVKKPSEDGALINEYISKFQKVNSAYGRLYGNPVQRNAVKRLIEDYDKELLTDIIDVLHVSNDMEYFPVITTPLELEKSCQRLIVAIRKHSKSAGSSQPTTITLTSGKVIEVGDTNNPFSNVTKHLT